ncbi:COG4223 family protein [Parasulfitobacter algicola]|uniref:Mitochondrial inner membrane protein n=1 Tax=Parasulfitobacter algicola TaxID=2614809 RepID=A0ABX2ISV0_9RHOB|nr:hypothetical protein [Sulfitobacter algicola]NSX55076.1 hypothetical protein [Sulfitobacter algicola]
MANRKKPVRAKTQRSKKSPVQDTKSDKAKAATDQETDTTVPTMAKGVAVEEIKEDKSADLIKDDDTIVDAEVVSETPPASDDATPEDITDNESIMLAKADDTVENAEISDEVADTDTVPDPSDDDVIAATEIEAAEEFSAEDETAKQYDEAPPPDTAAPSPVIVERKAGFIPMLVGGAIAAVLGFGAAMYLNMSGGNSAALEEINEEIAALNSSVSDLRNDIPAPYDDSSIMSSISTVSDQAADLNNQISALSDRLVGLDDRITEVEKRPAAENAQASVQAFERELETLRAQIAQERAEIEGIAAEAATMEENAQEAAEDQAARAALGRIQASLESGSPFANALRDLRQAKQIEVPEALTELAQTGAPTVSELQQSFPNAARAALAAYRATDTEGTTGNRITNFIMSQTQARSVEPREGDDPDAVLSRAEYFARNGNLTDALAEIETLPDVARSEMTGWTERTQARLDALDAAETLSQTLFSN